MLTNFFKFLRKHRVWQSAETCINWIETNDDIGLNGCMYERDSDGYTKRGARVVESSLKWGEKNDAICGVFFFISDGKRGCRERNETVRTRYTKKRCKKSYKLFRVTCHMFFFLPIRVSLSHYSEGAFFNSPIDTNPLVSTTIQFAVIFTCVTGIFYDALLMMIKTRVWIYHHNWTPLSIICIVSHDGKFPFQSQCIDFKEQLIFMLNLNAVLCDLCIQGLMHEHLW